MATSAQNSSISEDPFKPNSDGSLFESLDFDFERFGQQAFNLRFWLAGIVALALGIGALATVLATPLYQATARIEISKITVDLADTSGNRMADFRSDMQYFETQYELLESRFLAERVVEAGNLTRDAEFLNAFDLGETASPARAASILQRNMTVEPLDRSNLVDISFSSPSASKSAELANLYASQFLDANYEKRFGANVQARNYLEEQIGELRDKLAVSERDLVNYANANGIVVLEQAGDEEGSRAAGQTLVGRGLAGLNEALTGAVAARIQAESALRAGDFTGRDDAAMSGTRSNLAAAEANLAQLRSKFGPAYPEIKAAEAQVAVLRQAVNTSSSRDQGALQAAYRKALLEEQALASKVSQAKSGFLDQQNSSIEHGILNREVDTNRQLYDALLQRFKQLEASGAGNNNMTLIDRAQVPGSYYSPSLIRNLIIALLAAILIGILLVYIRETLDRTIRDPAEVRRQFGLNALGTIPRVPASDVIENLERRSSEISEAYAAVRTNLGFLKPESGPLVLMLTSSRPGEGKSLSTVAIARSFAEIGKKVLMIDTDLRNSGQAALLGSDVTGGSGLTTILVGEAEIEATIRTIPEHGFDYLPTGRKPSNPAELLAGPGLKSLIDRMRSVYDVIIVDGPPVLGLADSLEVSNAVDGILYVIESNEVNARVVRNALNRLRGGRAAIYGALITKLDDRNAAYGYGARYGYGYGYGSSEQA